MVHFTISIMVTYQRVNYNKFLFANSVLRQYTISIVYKGILRMIEQCEPPDTPMGIRTNLKKKGLVDYEKER